MLRERTEGGGHYLYCLLVKVYINPTTTSYDVFRLTTLTKLHRNKLNWLHGANRPPSFCSSKEFTINKLFVGSYSTKMKQLLHTTNEWSSRIYIYPVLGLGTCTENCYEVLLHPLLHAIHCCSAAALLQFQCEWFALDACQATKFLLQMSYVRIINRCCAGGWQATG